METYCVSCKKYNANKNSSITKQLTKIINAFVKLYCLWKKKLTFIKNKELQNFND